MKTYKLAAEPRTDLGKKAAKTLRSEGKIPVVLNGGEVFEMPFKGTLKPGEKIVEIENGRGMITTDLAVANDDVRKLIFTPDIYAVELDFNGDKKMAVLREVQYHPVTDEALHVDFLAVCETKPVAIDVPVIVTGHSEGVKLGGKLLVSSRKIRISALLDKLPDLVEVDTTSLQIGKQIVAGDLHFEGVNIVSPKATIICSVRPTRATAQAKAEASK